MRQYRTYFYDNGRDPLFDAFTLPADTVMTPELLSSLIDEFRADYARRYEILDTPFRREFAIYGRAAREDFKPDNRLAANFCRQIATTFEGYFIGNPVEYRNADDIAGAWIDVYTKRNRQAAVDASLSMGCTKYGRAFELLYMNEQGEPASAYISPRAGFVIYDDSVVREPLFGVTFAVDDSGSLFGAWSDRNVVVPFRNAGDGIEFDEPYPHVFGGVPLIEYTQDENAEGLYEGVMNLVDAFNAALSEKANDVEYFADAYLAVTGVELPEDFKADLREYRLINVWGEDVPNVYFLEKPNADTTQENLLARLETLIHKTAMVPDITDESFYTASGTALTKRLMPMANMAKAKEQRFKDSIRQRLRLLSSVPGESFTGDDWATTEIVMSRNMPPDLANEAQIAGALAGIVSEETQLSILSCVEDATSEIERKRTERDSLANEMYPALGGQA